MAFFVKLRFDGLEVVQVDATNCDPSEIFLGGEFGSVKAIIIRLINPAKKIGSIFRFSSENSKLSKWFMRSDKDSSKPITMVAVELRPFSNKVALASK